MARISIIGGNNTISIQLQLHSLSFPSLLPVPRPVPIAADDNGHLVSHSHEPALLIENIDIDIHAAVPDLARIHPAKQPFPPLWRRYTLDLDRQRERGVPMRL